MSVHAALASTQAWDGDVLAYEETNGTRTDWFYEPSSFRPLAKSENGKLFYIVNDHLGTPKEAFSEAGQLLWSVDHHTWGTVKSCWMSATLDPEPDPRGVYLGKGFQGEDVYSVRAGNTAMAYEASTSPDPMFVPIRFQGQYEDTETGLFYNFYRYYEPLAGIYVSPDPIGVVGGFRTQQYVPNPNFWVDPVGLRLRDSRQIHFSQDSVSCVYSDLMGRLINDPSYASQVEPIILVRLSDLPPNIQQRMIGQGANISDVFSLDNRRLLAARQAGVPVNSRFATPEDLNDINLDRRFTTKNAGRSICCGGLPAC